MGLMSPRLISAMVAMGLIAPDKAEAAPFSFKVGGKSVQAIKNFTRPEAESFVKELGGARVLQKGNETVAWPLYPLHGTAEDALNMQGSRRLTFDSPKEVQYMAGREPNLFRSMYAPGIAQFLQNRNMAAQQGLQEPTFDPVNLLAPGGMLGNISGEAFSALMKYLSDQRMNTESGI